MKFALAKEIHFTAIENIYNNAFPDNEREPFALLTTLRNYNFYVALDNDKVCAFASVIQQTECLIIDYLAVDKEKRGEGVGAFMLNNLCSVSKNAKCIFIEIERLGIGDNKEKEIRERRFKFYRKNRFIDMNTNIIFDGVKMQLMYLPLSEYTPTTQDYFRAFSQLESPKRKKIYLDN